MFEQVRIDYPGVHRMRLDWVVIFLELEVDVFGEENLGQLALVVRCRWVVIFAAIKRKKRMIITKLHR